MKNTSPLVSVVIVNWNGKHWLKNCLASLSKVTYRNVEWIIVDNASADGSVAWIKKRYPKTILVENSENLGFSHANNLGYKHARGEYILFLNNDTIVKPDVITELLKSFTKDRTIGCVQSKILLMDDHSRLDSIGAFLTPTGFLFHNNLCGIDKPELDRQTDLYTAKGASMMFRRDVLKKIEVDGWLFDPTYFAYFEETDLCHRVWLAGYRIVYAYKAIIYHKMGATSNMLTSSWVQFNSYKNRINSYIKNFGLLNLVVILPVHIVLCHALALVFLLKGNPSWFMAIQKAIWWNILHLPHTLHNRNFVQIRIRKCSDAKFFSKIMKFPKPTYYTQFLVKFLRIYIH
jgi:GT2 family glycosyltransferase